MLLIFVGIITLAYKYFNEYIVSRENNRKIAEFIEKQGQSFSSEKKKDLKENIEPVQEKQITLTQEFIAVLEIPKINLKKGLYEKTSPNNDVNRNIQILKESDMPGKINGNLLLAGHSGTGRTAYFRNLNSLLFKDEIYVYYQNKKYLYRVIDKYDITKTGKLKIKNYFGKQTLTLITCHHKTDKQLIIIAELVKEENI